MLQEFISTHTNNTYLIALFYLILWFLIIRISFYIIERIILTFTLKTKTNLDDLILKKASNPLTIITILIGIKIALSKIILGEILSNNLNLILNTFIGIVALYLLYIIFDLYFTRVMRSVSRRAYASPNEGLIQLTKSTIQVILILAGLIYILQIWGFNIGTILAGVGVAGIAIAFALQSSLGNIFGGVSIILDKSVNVGDLVTLSDGISGKIERIGVRSTKVKTFDNEMIIVPNSKLADSNIKNIAQPEPKSRVVIPFSVAYGSNVEKVKKIVLKEIISVAGFVKDPEPLVRFLEMGSSSLNFKAYFFVESYEQRFAAIDEANTKIYNALNKNKIEIPFPQMDVHIKKK